MSPTERTCCLTLDEMKITPTLDYDRISDSFIGHVTLPEKEEKAEHALVFMLGGLTTRWKQTVAYFFTGASVKGDLFHDIILEIVYRAEQIGLKVAAVTSDMGSANQAMWRSFNIKMGRNINAQCSMSHPCDITRRLYFISDPPHAIKNLRNFFLTGQEIKISPDIVARFELKPDVVHVSVINELHDAGVDGLTLVSTAATDTNLQVLHIRCLTCIMYPYFNLHTLHRGGGGGLKMYPLICGYGKL
jgi:hypothetical protein